MYCNSALWNYAFLVLLHFPGSIEERETRGVTLFVGHSGFIDSSPTALSALTVAQILSGLDRWARVREGFRGCLFVWFP